MPHKSRLIIGRHAESLEDVNNNIYDVLRDLDIPLTEKGREQSRLFGIELCRILAKKKRVRFYTSPGVRNVETLKIVLPCLPRALKVEVEVEPLIVKQDWGHITAENRPGIEADRYRIGVLRYTFPTGESAAHLIERLRAFKEKVFALQAEKNIDVVVFSHGFEFRVLLMLILGWDEDTFESFANLGNCGYRVLTREKDGTYLLDKPLEKRALPVTRQPAS